MRIKNELKKIMILGVLIFGISQFLGAQILPDGSFEGGSPSAVWNESSINFGTPLCTIGGCGTGGGTGPRTGDWWAWFGGITAYEAGSVDQNVVIPSGANELRFWLEIPTSSGTGADYLEVLIDGNSVFQVTDLSLGYTTYAEVIVDISAYADGNSHNIVFHSEIYGPNVTNFFVDDVSIIETLPVPIGSWSIVLSVLLIGVFIVIRLQKTNRVLNV